MVTLQTVEQQLKQAGCNFHLWGKAELRELCNILLPDEIIAQCVNGYYEGGFAMLCVTNHRVLLVDRKPMFLTVEDIRFDMISEVDYFFGMVTANVKIMTPNQMLRFTSWSQSRLRKLAVYTQQRVIELRTQQYGPMARQFEAPVAQTTASRFEVDPTPSSWGKPGRKVPVRKLASLALGAQQRLTRPSPQLQAQASSGFVNLSAKMPTNPYNKLPLLSRRRHYPPFH